LSDSDQGTDSSFSSGGAGHLGKPKRNPRPPKKILDGAQSDDITSAMNGSTPPTSLKSLSICHYLYIFKESHIQIFMQKKFSVQFFQSLLITTVEII
jgi:hypothetical protein